MERNIKINEEINNNNSNNQCSDLARLPNKNIDDEYDERLSELHYKSHQLVSFLKNRKAFTQLNWIVVCNVIVLFGIHRCILG